MNVGDKVSATYRPGVAGTVIQVDGDKIRVQWSSKKTWLDSSKLIRR